MIYTGKDQFQKGTVLLTMLSFLIPYFAIHTDDNDIYVVILLAVYIILLYQHFPFLRLLYKHGKHEKNFVYILIITISSSIIMSLFPKGSFTGYSLIIGFLFIWYFYFSTFKAGNIYIKNKNLAETTGSYRSTEND